MEKREAEELREVLSVVSKFLEDIKKPIADLINMMLDTLRGDKLGEDVAAFYAKLKEAGLPEDMIKDMTRRYLEERIKIASILDRFMSMLGKGPKDMAIVKQGGHTCGCPT